MLANDPYDWDGKKASHVFACEADEDGAVTMQILKMLSGKPSCLLDTRFYDQVNQIYLFQNCGIAPSFFAACSENFRDNLSRTTLCSCVPKFRGGGAHGCLEFEEGDYTLARLYQTADGYHMLILKAQAVSFIKLNHMPKAKNIGQEPL